MNQNRLAPGVSKTDVLARLASTALFSTLDESSLREVVEELEWVRLPGGDTLFQQGDAGDGLYIVMSGRLRVAVARELHTEEVIGEVGRGEMVGELAMLTRENRSATVRAIRDTELAKLSYDAWFRVAEKFPRILMHIAEVIAKRLVARNRSQRLLAPLASIAVVPTGPNVQLSEFVTRLASGLASIGSTLHLNSQRVRSIRGEEEVVQAFPESATTIKTDNWLNDQEDKYRYVLYEADSMLSNWTQRCIRQADHILIVGHAGADPVPGEIEAELLSQRADTTPAGQTLILLHKNGSQSPCGTQKWLGPRQVERCHHLRLDTDSDLNRLVRFLTGRAVGLVLGGGGARGFAHMGVIRALDEANINIDFVGGTSMGAVIAGEYAYGYDYQSMIRINKELFHRSNFDYTFPLTALLSARNAAKKLVEIFGDVKIEDLWLPFFCVSANLTRADLMIHRTGLLRRSLRASASIPGITPPVSDNGNLLVDGSVLNNLPIDVMSQLCTGGQVIAVDVSAPIDLANNLHYGDSVSGWKILWSRINPFGAPINVPNIASVLLRSAELATLKDQHKMLEQWGGNPCLRPPVENFQILDFGLIEKVADVGYRFTKQKIEECQEDGHRDGGVFMSPLLKKDR